MVHRSCDIDGWVFGIRSNSEAVGAWLDECIGEYLTDEEADPYYSIHVGEQGGSVKRYHILYRETRKLARTFDIAGLGRTLLSELESYLLPGRDDALYLDATVIAADGILALVPTDSAQFIDTLGSKVQRAGLTLPVETNVAIDLGSGETAPVKPLLRVPGDALARLARITRSNGRDERISLVRPVRVDTVVSIGLAEEPVRLVPPALAAYRLASHAVNLGAVGSAGLEALRHAVENARCVEVRASKAQDVLDALAAALHSQ